MISAASHPSTESRKMNSSTSSKSSPENQQNSAASSSLMLPLSSPPFSFIHSAPFFKQPFNLNPNFPLLTETTNVVREVQNSIFCNVDKCLSMLHDFRSPNLVHDKIMRLFYHIHTCCQIPYGKGQNFVRLSKPSFAAILPGDSVAGIVVTNGVLNFLNIYNTLLVVRLVLTWFPNAPPAVVSPLSTLCDPYLNIFRGIIPPLGGTLDLSPILAFLVLNAFTSTASALPAELPPTHDAVTDALAHHTASRQKWMQRLATAAGDKSSGQV